MTYSIKRSKSFYNIGKISCYKISIQKDGMRETLSGLTINWDKQITINTKKDKNRFKFKYSIRRSK